MKIPMPTPDEKNRSISYILQNVPERPATFSQSLMELFRTFGWRGLFFGVGDAAFVAVMGIAILFGVCIASAHSYVLTERLYGSLFFVSPFTYLLLYSLTMWKEKLSGVWDLKMTCRVTLRHLTAARMLCFGGAGTLTSVMLSGAVCYVSRDALSFFRLLGVSLCSLFLFAAMLLFLLLRLRGRYAQIICTTIWVMLGGAVHAHAGSGISLALGELPVAVLLTAAAAFFALFLLETRIYFFRREVKDYAIG